MTGRESVTTESMYSSTLAPYCTSMSVPAASDRIALLRYGGTSLPPAMSARHTTIMVNAADAPWTFGVTKVSKLLVASLCELAGVKFGAPLSTAGRFVASVHVAAPTLGVQRPLV